MGECGSLGREVWEGLSKQRPEAGEGTRQGGEGRGEAEGRVEGKTCRDRGEEVAHFA